MQATVGANSVEYINSTAGSADAVGGLDISAGTMYTQPIITRYKPLTHCQDDMLMMKATRYVSANPRLVLRWTVLTSLWFTCTRGTLALDGASNPEDQYHGWYVFFSNFSAVSWAVSVVVVGAAVAILWWARSAKMSKREWGRRDKRG